MEFSRRVRLYLSGLFFGLIILAFIIGKRGCSNLNELKLEELFITQPVKISGTSICKQKCIGLLPGDIVKDCFSLKVNFDRSQVHGDPQTYILEGNLNQMPAEILVLDSANYTVIKDIRFLKPVECSCK